MNPVLEATWRDSPGLWGTLCAIDHKTIGKRYLVTAFGFFVAAGVLAALMRLQLARPESTLIGPDLYNQLFTTHGTAIKLALRLPVPIMRFIFYLQCTKRRSLAPSDKVASYPAWSIDRRAELMVV